jgi:hypothetical protein
MRAPAPNAKDDDKLAELLGSIVNLNDTMAQLQLGMKSINAARQLGADVRQIIPNAGLLSNSAGRIAGINLYNGGAAASVVTVRDGTDANAAAILILAVPVGGTIAQWFMPGGISYSRGLFVTVAGDAAVQGAVYTGGPGARL